ncbi:MAG: hypothetical protein O2923_13295 [Verrucomicrobia bacterium]|nr:hypothetical protein [Verrucomicrobiota bacterium]MDA1088432.1 hypothetical protein [Verrucomicrobiota bacterium]
MHIRSLTHIVEAVHALVRPTRITVMDSSSLLAYDPSLGESGEPLELGLDADLLEEKRMFRAGRALAKLTEAA